MDERGDIQNNYMSLIGCSFRMTYSKEEGWSSDNDKAISQIRKRFSDSGSEEVNYTQLEINVLSTLLMMIMLGIVLSFIFIGNLNSPIALLMIYVFAYMGFILSDSKTSLGS